MCIIATICSLRTYNSSTITVNTSIIIVVNDFFFVMMVAIIALKLRSVPLVIIIHIAVLSKNLMLLRNFLCLSVHTWVLM